MGDYANWEASVIELIADAANVSRSDAAGIVESQAFYMQQSWGLGMTAQKTASKIIAVSAEPLATLEEIRAAISTGRERGALMIDGVPLELVGNLLDLLRASDEASQLLEAGKAKAARRALNKVLNQIPQR